MFWKGNIRLLLFLQFSNRLLFIISQVFSEHDISENIRRARTSVQQGEIGEVIHTWLLLLLSLALLSNAALPITARTSSPGRIEAVGWLWDGMQRGRAGWRSEGWGRHIPESNCCKATLGGLAATPSACAARANPSGDTLRQSQRAEDWQIWESLAEENTDWKEEFCRLSRWDGGHTASAVLFQTL